MMLTWYVYVRINMHMCIYVYIRNIFVYTSKAGGERCDIPLGNGINVASRLVNDLKLR